MASAKEQIVSLAEQLKGVQLMVVTKHRSAEEIRQVVQAGVKIIGENRLQEIEKKYDNRLFTKLTNSGVELHFIGHLQTNKATRVVRACDAIQSVDSLRLAQEVNKQAARLNKVMPIFLQLNLTEEAQKYGLLESELEQAVHLVQQLPQLQLRGLMCMGMVGDDEKTRSTFRACKVLADQFNLPEVSMGMSGDYLIAVEEGSTMVRLGSVIFENT